MLVGGKIVLEQIRTIRDDRKEIREDFHEINAASAKPAMMPNTIRLQRLRCPAANQNAASTSSHAATADQKKK